MNLSRDGPREVWQAWHDIEGIGMHKEIDFENDIEHALVSSGGYEKGDPNTYDPETALFPADVLAFVQKTQPKVWTRLTQLDAAKAPATLLDSLVKELAYFAPTPGWIPRAPSVTATTA